MPGQDKQWPSGHGRPWLAEAGRDRPWPAMANPGRQWQNMSGHGLPWPAVAGHGQPWQALAHHGRSRPEEASGRVLIYDDDDDFIFPIITDEPMDADV